MMFVNEALLCHLTINNKIAETIIYQYNPNFFRCGSNQCIATPGLVLISIFSLQEATGSCVSQSLSILSLVVLTKLYLVLAFKESQRKNM